MSSGYQKDACHYEFFKFFFHVLSSLKTYKMLRKASHWLFYVLFCTVLWFAQNYSVIYTIHKIRLPSTNIFCSLPSIYLLQWYICNIFVPFSWCYFCIFLLWGYVDVNKSLPLWLRCAFYFVYILLPFAHACSVIGNLCPHQICYFLLPSVCLYWCVCNILVLLETIQYSY